MPKRLGFGLFVLCAVMFGSARPALAQQTFNVTFGYFSVQGEDALVAVHGCPEGSRRYD